MRPARRPGKKPRTMDRVALLALELTNKGHAVPTDVLQAALQENSLILASHTVVGRDVAVISPPSASDARLGEPPAPSAPSAPPGLTSDSDWLGEEDEFSTQEEDPETSYDYQEEDMETSSQEEDQEVQFLLPARWLQSGTCEVLHGTDAAGRCLWSYLLSCAEPGCRVAAMTHAKYYSSGSTPVDEATKEGWTKHKTQGWRGALCPAHGGRRR